LLGRPLLHEADPVFSKKFVPHNQAARMIQKLPIPKITATCNGSHGIQTHGEHRKKSFAVISVHLIRGCKGANAEPQGHPLNRALPGRAWPHNPESRQMQNNLELHTAQ
jgi:hypothetical protein